jgi:hypothetical protein
VLLTVIVIGLLGIHAALPQPGYPQSLWLRLAFLAPTTAFIAWALVYYLRRRNVVGLWLDADGFEIVGCFKSQRVEWKNTTRFTLQSIELDGSAFRELVFVEDGQPNGLGNNRPYGLAFDRLTKLMNGWRELALGEDAQAADDRNQCQLTDHAANDLTQRPEVAGAR